MVSRTSKLPIISVLLPTLNSEKVIGGCLESIFNQDYPKDKLEIIVADGGSTDRTLEIAKKFKAKIFPNPLKTGEAGKMVALRQAKGQLVALIDSDNILSGRDWLKRMVVPFSDEEVLGSEPWKYTYREKDGFIDRYCALVGMNDPICNFLGNYDRYNLLTRNWTGLPVKQVEKRGWIKVVLQPGLVPTIGANGTIFRRKLLVEVCLKKNYFFDIDVLSKIIEERPVSFAKVKIGIVHLFCGNDVKKFCRKQKRRIKDYFFYQRGGLRAYPWQSQYRLGILKFTFFCLLIFPLWAQAIKGYFRKKDKAWFFHPIACWITLIIYGFGVISGLFFPKAQDRKNWNQ